MLLMSFLDGSKDFEGTNCAGINEILSILIEIRRQTGIVNKTKASAHCIIFVFCALHDMTWCCGNTIQIIFCNMFCFGEFPQIADGVEKDKHGSFPLILTQFTNDQGFLFYSLFTFIG